MQLGLQLAGAMINV